ncbi:MAG: LamG-like jellyroll fold domain-containing protein [Bacteroidota bacterium]
MWIKALTNTNVLIVLAMLIMNQGSFAQCPRDISKSTTPPEDELALYLPLDNNLANLGNDVFDLELNGAIFVSSKCNFGLEFDGLDDYLRINPSLNLVDDFTITAWIKPYNQEEQMGIFSIREQCASSFMGFSMASLNINEYNVQGLSYQVNKHENCSGWSGGDRYIDPNISIQNHEEVFVAVRVQNNNSENRLVTLFVNCQEYSTETALDQSSAEAFEANRDYISTIGASSSVEGFSNTFDGLIDEVRVYTKALNQDEILDIYFSCLPLTMDITKELDDCKQELTYITLYDTEPDVNYQLVDITNNQLVHQPITGNCGEIVFTVDGFEEPTFLQIQARNLQSDCLIDLDTIIEVLPSSKFIYLSDTTHLCEGDSIWIDDEYIRTNSYISDTIYSLMSCDSILNTFYVFTPPLDYNLGTDTILCAGNSILFDVSDYQGNYTWQDNSKDPIYEIKADGTYSLRIENGCDTILSSINVQFEDCCTLHMPNTFSPNFDGINDEFKAIINRDHCKNITSFRMKIFDRWGSCVFESQNIDYGWDGMFVGKNATIGIYVYIIEYFNGSNLELLRGNVTLVK